MDCELHQHNFFSSIMQGYVHIWHMLKKTQGSRTHSKDTQLNDREISSFHLARPTRLESSHDWELFAN